MKSESTLAKALYRATRWLLLIGVSLTGLCLLLLTTAIGMDQCGYEYFTDTKMGPVVGQCSAQKIVAELAAVIAENFGAQ